MIWDYHGTPHRTVAVLQDGSILSEEDAGLREEVNGRALPRCVEWRFRLVRTVFTDGPTLSERLAESNETQRNRAETRMFDRQNEFFAAMMEKMGMATSEDPTHLSQTAESPTGILEQLKSMPELQRNAMLEAVRAELEGSPAGPELNLKPEAPRRGRRTTKEK